MKVEVSVMVELVLRTSTLPQPLANLVCTKKVKVCEVNGVISLIPILDDESDCPLRGLAADSRLTVDRFLAMTHDEMETCN